MWFTVVWSCGHCCPHGTPSTMLEAGGTGSICESRGAMRSGKRRRRAGIAIGVALVVGLGLTAVPGSADPLQLSCTGSTACSSGATSLITTSTSTPTFDLITPDNGGLTRTGFLGVLVPNGTASFTVLEGASLIPLEESKTFSSGTSLGDPGNLNEPFFSDYTF